jgi:hypothetical protein
VNGRRVHAVVMLRCHALMLAITYDLIKAIKAIPTLFFSLELLFCFFHSIEPNT